jgi:invasion protein IalB
MDFSRKPFASVAALLLLALFTACSPAAEEPAALAQPSRGAHRSAGWELPCQDPHNPACWPWAIQQLDSFHTGTKWMYRMTVSAADYRLYAGGGS